MVDRVWLRDAALVSLACSLFIGFIGPFGDYETTPLAGRLAAWTAIGLSGYGIFAALLLVMDRRVSNWPWGLRQAIAVVVGTVPLAPVIGFLDRWITGDDTDGGIDLYFTALPVGVVYLMLFEIVRVARRQTASTEAASADDASSGSAEEEIPRLLRRVPEDVAGMLICLEKEDHYLRVHTENGNCLIRLRMNDATEELGALKGVQTHRSWWVADHAVVRAHRKPSGGGSATLSNGMTVPIARARLADAQEAGWFDR